MKLQAKDYPPGSFIYSFVEKDTGKNTHVDSELLRKWCAEHKEELRAKEQIQLTPVTARIAVSFLEGNVIDLGHAAAVGKMETLDPIIYGKTGTITNDAPDVLLIDGHHRYFLAWATKTRFIPAYLLEPDQWRQFEIHGMPDLTEDMLRALPNKAQYKRMKGSL